MRSVLRRPVLLLSAAATITVPGAFAALAMLGHQHEGAARGARGTTASAGQQAEGLPGGRSGGASSALSGLTGGSATGPGGAGSAMTPAGAVAGVGVGVGSGSGQERARGMRLLTLAASAGRFATYEGREAIADTTVAGPSSVRARVWHQGGGLTVTQISGGRPERTYGSDVRDPEGVFGVTTTLVGLLEKRYVPVYLGAGSVIGRPALMVAARRADGTTAAQYWLDARTMLPLRREVYDTSAHLVSDERFTEVRFGMADMPKGAAGPGGATWMAASSPLKLLYRLNGSGIPLPRTLPGNLSLYAASEAATPSGRVADLGFSDGLAAVSLFVEHGSLPATMPGWQPERLSGHLVYVAQHEVTMEGGGFVYTLVYDAPPAAVDAVVGALPSNGNPGILVRLGRGLGRLVSVLDPFR